MLPAAGLEPVVSAFGGECSLAEIARLVGKGRATGAVADDLDLPVILTPTLTSTDSPCSALSMIYSAAAGVEEMRSSSAPSPSAA